MRPESKKVRALLAPTLFIASLAIAPVAAAEAVSWYVNAQPGCSDSGPGTSESPLCTISQAAKRAMPGEVVLVASGVYREQVTLPRSGSVGAPITFRAAPDVVVLGTRDLSTPEVWAPTASTAWTTSYAPPSAPKQVFVDDAALAAVTGVDQVVPGTFHFDAVAKVLTVDTGGGNPGEGHQVEAGAVTYAFKVWSLSDIVIEGFATRAQNGSGVSVQDARDVVVRQLSVSRTFSYGIFCDRCGTGVALTGNEVQQAGSAGLRLRDSAGVLVERNLSHDNRLHGIGLSGSSGNRIAGNVLHDNAKPGVRVANGIDVNGGSNDNLVIGNLAYRNQDSGIQVYNGSGGNVMARNASHDNGDHGFDTVNAARATYIGNTAYRNYKDGFSVEGASGGARLSDNIAVDNGVATGNYDLFVDSESALDFASDGQILWKTAPGTVIRHAGSTYASVADFAAATGNEARGLDADPVFLDATGGDLRLRPGSPGIDAADSSAAGFANEDLRGVPAIDHPRVTDTGVGTVSYADRGAYEYDGPVASLAVTPPSGSAPLAVTADASASVALGASLATFRFDCGGGLIAEGNSPSVATCDFDQPGTFIVTVGVQDTSGQADEAMATVEVQPANQAPTAVLSATPASGQEPLQVVLDASASTDPDQWPIATYRFDCGNGVVHAPSSTSSASCTYTAGSYLASVTVTDTAGLSGTATADVSVAPDLPPVAALKLSPNNGRAPLVVKADASGSTDNDETPIASYRFDCGNGTVAGPQASPRTECRYGKAGTYTVTVWVTDTAGLVGTTSRNVRVRK